MIHAPRLEDGKIFVPQPFCEINFVLDCAAHISFPWCGISRDVMVSLLSTKRGGELFFGELARHHKNNFLMVEKWGSFSSS